MINFRRLLIIVSIFLPGTLFSQEGKEVIVDLESLPFTENKTAHKNRLSILELPFFDDFSRDLPYPSSERWEAKHVFLNTQYAVNPPNPGVVTFDAIDKSGKLHSVASNFPFSSDTLISNPINLSYPTDTSIYLSFFFQPQGLGNRPDDRDSLLLEFYNHNLDTWEGAWASWLISSENSLYQLNKLKGKTSKKVSARLDSTFFLVHMPITEERFLNSNFRFRFRNIASLSANTDVPGLRGNSDHWHIDMIYLNRGRTYRDTLFNDISFSRPLKSILKNYEQIPWLHFTSNAIDNELSNPLTFNVAYKNLGLISWNVTRLYSIKNHSNNEVYSFSGGAENIAGQEVIEYDRRFQYGFSSSWSDSARFTFSSYLITDIAENTSHLRWNDTLKYVQNFQNFYAYDDGTAESGYGLFGEGTQNGQVALKYTTYKADKLVGVYMYFNRTFNDANQKYFKLAVWDDNKGKPGEIIYEQLGVRPLFTDSLNRFTLFKLDEEVELDAGTFYIGWIQTTNDMLNVGYDRNNDSKKRLFYNIGGAWNLTQFYGSLMVRPVFGKLTENPTKAIQNTLTGNLHIFPNPTRGIVNIEYPNVAADVSVFVYNTFGQLVMSQQLVNNVLNVERLANGTYIVRVVGNNKIIGTQKLVIAKW